MLKKIKTEKDEKTSLSVLKNNSFFKSFIHFRWKFDGWVVVIENGFPNKKVMKESSRPLLIPFPIHRSDFIDKLIGCQRKFIFHNNYSCWVLLCHPQPLLVFLLPVQFFSIPCQKLIQDTPWSPFCTPITHKKQNFTNNRWGGSET